MTDPELTPDPDMLPEPANLRLLRLLVTGLTAVMIGGLLLLLVLLVIRVNQPDVPRLPDAVIVPDGEMPLAVTFGPGWLAVVTDGMIRIYDTESGELRQEVAITAP